MYKATTVMRGNHHFESTVDGQSVLMDTGSEQKAGQSPMELLLSAVSGCASVDVVEIMQKKRRTVAGLIVETQAERREEPFPKIFTQFHLHFKLQSPDAKAAELEQAVALSMDKYCSVAGALRGSAQITHSCEVIAAP